MKYRDINISLKSKTISDTVSCAVAEVPASINISVLGQTFSFDVDEQYYNQITGLYDITGSYSLQDKLNLDINGRSSPVIDFTDDAQSIVSKTIQKLSKTPVLHFDDFSPTGLKASDSNSDCVCDETFSSLLQKVFGWTDIVPTTLVNVFQRGNNIYCLQRGKELGTVTIADAVGTPTIRRQTLNLIYPSHKNYYLTGELKDYTSNNSSDGDNPDTLVSGTFTSGENTLTYAYGLLTGESYASGDGTKTGTTAYDYSGFYPPANLTGKTITQTETITPDIPELTLGMLPYRVVTSVVNSAVTANTYATNGRDLIKSVETTTTTTTGYNIVDLDNGQDPFTEVEESITETRYTDMGQGFWAVVVYRSGLFVSSQTVTGNPGGRATPYAIKRNSTVGGRSNVLPKRVQLSGKFAGNMRIGVSDLSTLQRIAAAIEALHGKTEERVSLKYFGPNFCDFTIR